MGLDQYAHARAPGRVVEDEEIAYWRKHSALEGWASTLAVHKGLVDKTEDFNCVELTLTEKDLDSLKGKILSSSLQLTEGYFFSIADYDPSMYAKDDLAFIKTAKKKIKEGYSIIYSSWW